MVNYQNNLSASGWLRQFLPKNKIKTAQPQEYQEKVYTDRWKIHGTKTLAFLEEDKN